MIIVIIIIIIIARPQKLLQRNSKKEFTGQSHILSVCQTVDSKVTSGNEGRQTREMNVLWTITPQMKHMCG